VRWKRAQDGGDNILKIGRGKKDQSRGNKNKREAIEGGTRGSGLRVNIATKYWKSTLDATLKWRELGNNSIQGDQRKRSGEVRLRTAEE